MAKYVYFFGGNKAEGDASMKNLLGGKGANLAEMTNLGITVPSGFTITTEVCTRYYENNKEYPPEFETSCKVIILMNAPVIKDPNIEALMTRAHLVHFNPSNTEILKYMEPWTEDPQVFDFVKKF